MKPAEMSETAAAMLPNSCIGRSGRGGEEAGENKQWPFLEKRTLWCFCCLLNSPRGPCVLACAPLYAEDSFHDHEETNNGISNPTRGNETPLIHLRRTSFSTKKKKQL